MRLLDSIRQHAGALDASRGVPRWGIVQSVNPAKMLAKVTLQPENVLTDWLPILSSTVGNGWGIVHPPAAGTQVLCLPDAGDHENYVILGATWSSAGPPPAAAQGELWLVHSSGAKIALTSDGKITLTDAGGAVVGLTNDGNVSVTGNLHVSGAVVAGFGGGDAVSLQTHKHGTGTAAAGTSAPTAGT